MINTFSFGSYILVYNGQIYNTKELSETLKENGFTLNSHSDTEVVLKAYIEWNNEIYPISEQIHDEVISLPISGVQSLENTQIIIKVLNEFK